MKYKMRTVVKVRNAGIDNNSRQRHWLKLECGHFVTPLWNYKTFYVKDKTRARCYECTLKDEQ